MKLFFSLALTICALLGILDAGYITYTKLAGILPTCRPPFACQTVLESKWSSVGSIPLSAFGVVFYSTMLILAIIAFMDLERLGVGKLKVKVHNLLAILGTFGLFFSLWLVFIMGVLIKAWCLFCLLSAINCFFIFILTVSIYALAQEKAP